MKHVLVIGYGNPYRRDDGVGLAVVNGLRQRLGLGPLEEEDGSGELGREVDTLFLQQLTPEWAEVVAGYEEVLFVDAHLGIYPEAVCQVAVEPQVWAAATTHHLWPEMLLALAQALYGHAPRGQLLSIRGHDFDFGTELSPEAQAGVAEAVERIWNECVRADAEDRVD